jgi:hypothetical protein
MPIRLGMLGIWHTHADSIVRMNVSSPAKDRRRSFASDEVKTRLCAGPARGRVGIDSNNAI